MKQKIRHFFTLGIVIMLSMLFVPFTTLAQEETEGDEEQTEEKQKKKRKRKDEFKIYAGINFNTLIIDEEHFKSTMAPGFKLGGSYKRGRFFYWEIGAAYNNSVYHLDWVDSPDTVSWSDGLFSVRNIDIPITLGINILSFTSRIAGLRAFVSAVPAFTLDIGENDIGIEKDDLNNFIIYGRGGVGIDAAFLFIEAGMNYGFEDILEKDINSKPIQIFLNLGFRF